MNIVARSDSLYAEAIAAIGAVFPVVLEMAVEEDINRIVVAMVTKRTGISSGKKQHRQRERERERQRLLAPARAVFSFQFGLASERLHVPACLPNATRLLLLRATVAGLVKSTVELHKAAGASWGRSNPNAAWTEEVTSAAKTALKSAKVAASDGKVAAGVGGGGSAQPQAAAGQQTQKKAAPSGGGKKKSRKKKR